MENDTIFQTNNISIVYHGGCLDGFISVSLIHLLTVDYPDKMRYWINSILDHKSSNYNAEGDQIINIQSQDIEMETEKSEQDHTINTDEFQGLEEIAFKFNHYFHDSEPIETFFTNRNYSIYDSSTKCTQQQELLMILDVSNPELIRESQKYFKYVIVIDHHQTLFKTIIGTNQENMNEDMEESNLVVYYNLEYSTSKIIFFMIKKLLEKVDESNLNLPIDYDLQNLKSKIDFVDEFDTMPPPQRSKESQLMGAAIYKSYAIMDFINGYNTDHLSKIIERKWQIYAQIGIPLVQNNYRQVGEFLKKSKIVKFQYKNDENVKIRIKCRAVQFSYRSIVSHLGHELARMSKLQDGNDPIGIVFRKNNKNGRINYDMSFRGYQGEHPKKMKREGTYKEYQDKIKNSSDQELEEEGEKEELDLETLARYFNGGGHKLAAGCTVNKLPFQQ